MIQRCNIFMCIIIFTILPIHIEVNTYLDISFLCSEPIVENIQCDHHMKLALVLDKTL